MTCAPLIETGEGGQRRWLSEVRVPTAYAMVSVAACAIDFAVTMVLAASSAILAAAGGYLCGLVVHWILSTRLVFAGAAAISGRARYRQKALYLVSGLAGLLATIAVYTSMHAAGAAPPIAKACAIAVSFVITYVWRRYFLFK